MGGRRPKAAALPFWAGRPKAAPPLLAPEAPGPGGLGGGSPQEGQFPKVSYHLTLVAPRIWPALTYNALFPFPPRQRGQASGGAGVARVGRGFGRLFAARSPTGRDHLTPCHVTWAAGAPPGQFWTRFWADLEPFWSQI